MTADKKMPAFPGDQGSDVLREKYRRERDRRLRPNQGRAVAAAADLGHREDDLWADPDFVRDPLCKDMDVLVVGGGFGGLLAAARLREAKIDEFYIVEKAGDFGGTWYWNRYPGAACDTESYVYLPLLEETGYIPERKYARAPEIFEHAKRIGNHFDLYARALFQTVIIEMRWDDGRSRWLVKTDRGDELSARFVILAGGALHRPKFPAIPGIETFGGHSFHTTRWDYDYTGGDASGNLSGLRDKRVGIIGTGATAVQCIPHLGRWSKELFVFQRTPSAVGERNDGPTDPRWVEALQPGWQRERMANFTAVISGAPFETDLVNDAWTEVIGKVLLAAKRRAATGGEVADAAALMQQADFEQMDGIRQRVASFVTSAETAEALKPWYNLFCKRPCFHDEYLPTFNRSNVHLIDTGGAGVERITSAGVVVEGQSHDLDCLIFATGFEINADFTRRMGFEIYGRGGTTLSDKWKDGVSSLHGIVSRGFPNCLIISFVQSGQSANFTHMIDEQTKHAVHLIDTALRRGVASLEPTEQAEMGWVNKIVRAARGRQAYLQECTPGYYNNDGVLDEKWSRNSPYWRGPMAFVAILEAWRRDGNLEGLELGFAPGAQGSA